MSRLAHRVATALAALGALLLATSTVIELSDTNARAELWFGVGAGVTFLVAMVFSPGSEARPLALRARLLVGAGLSALLAVSGLWQVTERSAPRVLLLLIPVCLLFTTAALALREAAYQRDRARIRELSSRQAGEEAERRRWVRELHDDTLQELAAVHVLLAGAAADPGTRSESGTRNESGTQSESGTRSEPGTRSEVAAIAQARDIVGHQIQALRRLISHMRPLALDSLGLSAALEDLARHTGDAADLDIRVHAQLLPRLPADAEATIYRIVQEALTNAARHSGAHTVEVGLYLNGPGLDIVIRDDGHGSAGPFTPGHGLTGMRERAEILGGTLTVTPDGPGTTVRLHVPEIGPKPAVESRTHRPAPGDDAGRISGSAGGAHAV